MKELDPIIHSQLRLEVLSLLMCVKEADFMALKERTGSTVGNMSVQISKLVDAGYITIEKTFYKNRPRTICRVTEKGREAFVSYVAALKNMLGPAINASMMPDGVMPELVPGI